MTFYHRKLIQFKLFDSTITYSKYILAQWVFIGNVMYCVEGDNKIDNCFERRSGWFKTKIEVSRIFYYTSYCIFIRASQFQFRNVFSLNLTF